MNILIAIQALMFYLLPTVVGRAMVVVLPWGKQKREHVVKKIARRIKNQKEELEELDGLKGLGRLGNVVVYFALGILVVFGLAMALRYGQNVTGIKWDKVFFPGVWGMGILGLLINLWRLPKGLIQTGKKLVIPGMLILVLAVIAEVIWMYKSPYPLNWDWYQHQTLATLIQKGHLEFFTTRMTDTFTFDSYPPIFHVLMAVAQFPSTLLRVNPLNLTPTYVINFWNIISFYHLITVGIASFALGVAVTRRRIVGYLSAVMGILFFDSAVSFSNFFLLPQTLAAVIWGLAISLWWQAYTKKQNLAWWKVIILTAVMVLMHYMVGGLGAVIFLGLVFYGRIKSKWPKLISGFPLVPVLLGLMVLGVILSGVIKLNQVNRGEAELYTFDLFKKQDFLEHVYGYSAYILVPMGIFLAITRLGDGGGLALLILTGFSLILASNFPYVLKFYTLARLFIHLFMAMGIWSFLVVVRSRVIKGLGLVAITGVFIVMLVVNTLFWKSGLVYQGKYTHIGEGDIKLAEFLQGKYGTGCYPTSNVTVLALPFGLRSSSSPEYRGGNKDGCNQPLMVSDPGTQFVLEGLSGVDTAGGAYMNSENRRLLYQGLINGGEIEPPFARGFGGVKDNIRSGISGRILVISGRTMAWMESSEKDRMALNINEWTPKDLSAEEIKMISDLEATTGWREVYRSVYAVVVEGN